MRYEYSVGLGIVMFCSGVFGFAIQPASGAPPGNARDGGPNLEQRVAFFDSPGRRFRHYQLRTTRRPKLVHSSPVPGGLPNQNQQPPVLKPIIGGTVAGAIGFFGGALAGALSGARIGCDEPDEQCGILDLTVGAAIGEVVLAPIGVHIGNRRRGNFLLDFLTSATVATAAFVAFGHSRDATLPAVIVASAAVQIGATVAIERLWAAR